MEPGELFSPTRTGGASVWYTWTATTNGQMTVDTVGSSFDTQLAVYTGNTVSSLRLIKYDDDSGYVNYASKVSFYAVAGTNYHICVVGLEGGSGDIVLRLWLGPLPPAFHLSTAFAHPTDTNATTGSDARMSVSLIFDPQYPWSYQWLKNGEAVPGATNYAITLTNVQPIDSGLYSVFCSNALGSATTSNALLTVVPILITSQPRNITIAEGYPASLFVSAAGLAPTTYQWRKNGETISGATASWYRITAVQPQDAGLYSVAITNALTNALSTEATLTVVPPFTFGTLAGRAQSSGASDGIGAMARFNGPHGIAVDSLGYTYVTDSRNHTIRRISPGGTVATIAGSPGVNGTTDGPGSIARFATPWGIAFDPAGNVFVADTGNHTIRKIASDGLVTTVAGKAGVSGYDNGVGEAARFKDPSDIAVDAAGNLFVADHGNNKLRKVTPLGTVTTIAAWYGYSGSADGPALKAKFNQPSGLAFDSAGDLWVTDEYNHTLRKLSMAGVVSTVAGMPGSKFPIGNTPDGTGTEASFNYPHGPRLDTAGNLYIADTYNCLVRRVSTNGTATTVAGKSGQNSWGDGQGIQARFSNVRGVAVDSWGNLYVTDYDNQTIRKGTPATANFQPLITLHPRSQTVAAGSKVELTVAAGGSGMLSFQWFRGDLLLGNATNDTLTISSVQPSLAGAYSVIVSNLFGVVRSETALLSVLAPPVLQMPTSMPDGTVELRFQNCDGGVPSDLSNIEVQCRRTVPFGSDTNWESLVSEFSTRNGYVVIQDTNALSRPTQFYRVLYK